MTQSDRYMALSREIAPHLPLLRRYARACTGSQQSGDALVAETLDSIIENPVQFDSTRGARVGLYRHFEVTAASPDEGNLSRRCLLLTTLEDFDVSSTAFILGKSEEEVGALIDAELERQDRRTKSKILLIEDELVVAYDLRDIVTAEGHEVVGIATTSIDAITLAQIHKPDLILADIQLADGKTGIDAVKTILTTLSPEVIFITAYPDALLTDERPEPTFLITKPYSPDMVRAAVSQALFFSIGTPIV